MPTQNDPRIAVGNTNADDAFVLDFPAGKQLVQTVDFLTPMLNDPYRYGQIAAANSLSDVYAMGGTPFAAMNIVCFPAGDMADKDLQNILYGGFLKMQEAGAVLAGGHSVVDSEVKYGLCVSGLVDPGRAAVKGGLQPGDILVLTKGLGTGVLASAIKKKAGDEKKLENTLYASASRLNSAGAAAIQRYGLTAATDITGFGLGGHAIEMALASNVEIELFTTKLPLLPYAYELTTKGFLPKGSKGNRNFYSKNIKKESGLDEHLIDLVFDAQTSGGLLLAVPPEKIKQVSGMLTDLGDLAACVGEVTQQNRAKSCLLLSKG